MKNFAKLLSVAVITSAIVGATVPARAANEELFVREGVVALQSDNPYQGVGSAIGGYFGERSGNRELGSILGGVIGSIVDGIRDRRERRRQENVALGSYCFTDWEDVPLERSRPVGSRCRVRTSEGEIATGYVVE